MSWRRRDQCGWCIHDCRSSVHLHNLLTVMGWRGDVRRNASRRSGERSKRNDVRMHRHWDWHRGDGDVVLKRLVSLQWGNHATPRACTWGRGRSGG